MIVLPIHKDMKLNCSVARQIQPGTEKNTAACIFDIPAVFSPGMNHDLRNDLSLSSCQWYYLLQRICDILHAWHPASPHLPCCFLWSYVVDNQPVSLSSHVSLREWSRPRHQLGLAAPAPVPLQTSTRSQKIR